MTTDVKALIEDLKHSDVYLSRSAADALEALARERDEAKRGFAKLFDDTQGTPCERIRLVERAESAETELAKLRAVGEALQWVADNSNDEAAREHAREALYPQMEPVMTKALELADEQASSLEFMASKSHDNDPWKAALLAGAKALRTPAPSGWVSVPREPTEAMIDAPRYFILYYETPGRSLEGARKHMELSGVDIDSWPEWAKTEQGHLTKSGIASIMYAMFLAALPSDEQGGRTT